MKLRQIVSELQNDYRLLQRKFLAWLKRENIKFTKKKALTESEYIKVEFDNGTDYPEEITIRFSDHKYGYNEPDIDTFTMNITQLEKLFEVLEEKYYLVIENGKYIGQSKTQMLQNGRFEWVPIEVKRG